MLTGVEMSAESPEGAATPTRRGPFRPRVLVVGLGCLLVAGGVALWWAGWPGTAAPAPVSQTSNSAPPTPISSPAAETDVDAVTEPKATSAEDSAGSPDDATNVVTSFLKVLGHSGPDGGTDESAIEEVAAGAILEEIKNSNQELEANGWKSQGVSTVKSLTILSQELTDSSATMTVQACVDSSAIVVTDSMNVPIVGEGENRNDSALNIFTIQKSDESWRIVARTFPNNPAC